ncbi:IMPACT family protein [Halocalculus aciditolerans]|uniref:YigZ family protein n=1 Tax=Halocalculus aciditolerans TaxID=1383812 RepID=A0A830F7C8_9EURY|nr:YigZ family protein [Halocalculus aciditolerans]GGL48077.1 hypothetical protein GCM10009039_02840 [Halocalculus aciditolerans]
MAESYLTVSGPGRASFEVRGSEFIGHVRHAATTDEAEAFVDAVCDEHVDATHNVPAYRVRIDSNGPTDSVLLREYSSDDGEPSGSAGKPMLNVLQGQELENVVAVVTRYYGGTNLGVGGLVRAYGKAVKDAVADTDVVEEVPKERFTATVEYDDSGTVRGILESADCEFDADYAETVSFAVTVPRADASALRERLRNATSGRVELGG